MKCSACGHRIEESNTPFLDAVGVELKDGDTVVFSSSSNSVLTKGTVVGFTPHRVKIRYTSLVGSPQWERTITSTKTSRTVCKYENNELES